LLSLSLTHQQEVYQKHGYIKSVLTFKRERARELYLGQYLFDQREGLGQWTYTNDETNALRTHTGACKNGKAHGRSILNDLRSGAWIEYNNWVDGDFAPQESLPIRWRFRDGMVYEGMLTRVSVNKFEGNGTLYSKHDKVRYCDCVLATPRSTCAGIAPGLSGRLRGGVGELQQGGKIQEGAEEGAGGHAAGYGQTASADFYDRCNE